MLVPETNPTGFVGTLPQEPDVETPGFGEVAGAALRRENVLAGAAVNIAQGRRADIGRPLNALEPFNADYDPFSEIPEDKRQYAGAYIYAQTPEDVAQINAKIDQEIADTQTLDSAGLGGWAASMAAGILDPINLIPVGGSIARTGTMGRSALRGGLATAKAGFVGATLSEIALQGLQETRTPEESMLNVAGGTLLAGILGSGAGAILSRTGRSFDDLAKSVERDLEVPEWTGDHPRDVAAEIGIEDSPDLRALMNDVEEIETAEGGSVGAAQLRPVEDKLKSALGAEKALSGLNPILRLMASPSVAARRIFTQLAENPLTLTKNAEGIASNQAVETFIKVDTAPLGYSMGAQDELLVKMRTGKAGGAVQKARIQAADLAQKPDALTMPQFREEVGRAMRRNDSHKIPEVAEAAKTYRKALFDPLKERAIKVGFFDENVKVTTADSYLTRVYRTEKIVARRNEFVNILRGWLQETSNLDVLEAEQVAQDLTDVLISNPTGRILYDAVPLSRGPLKERTLDIPDEMIEDFLESDIEVIARRYQRTMSADVGLAEKFGRADMADQIAAINEEYQNLLRRAKTEKARTQLQARRERDIRDIEALRDMLRGTYAQPSNPHGIGVRAQRVVMEANLLSKLGGMQISAISDLGRSIMVEGVYRTMKSGIVPMIRDMKQVRMSARETRLAGSALDVQLDTRVSAIADLGDDYGRFTKFERGMGAAASNFGLVTAMSPWNAKLKGFAGNIIMTRMLETADAWSAGKGSKSDIEKLASQGISQSMAKRIAAQATKHGQRQSGLWNANTSAWTDDGAVRAFRAGLVRDIDRTIVTPGISDRPLWMSKQGGKLIGQFRSFSMAATQRVLISGLQQRDAAALNGLMLSIGLGMMTYYLKAKVAGYDVSDDPRVWVSEGIDRSGVTGFAFDVNNIVEKVSRGRVGVNAVMGGPMMSRYASRNAMGALLGPTYGLVQDAIGVTGAAAAGEFKQSDLRAVRKMLPYQNLFYIRWLLDEAEASIGEAMGLE